MTSVLHTGNAHTYTHMNRHVHAHIRTAIYTRKKEKKELAMNTKASICWDLMGLPGLARELKSIVSLEEQIPNYQGCYRKTKRALKPTV